MMVGFVNVPYGMSSKNIITFCIRMPVNKYKVYDVLHKSVALGLITFTGVGTVWLGYKAFWWYSGKS